MFKTIDELKSFILWAKANKIKKLKVDTVEVELSELDFIQSSEMSDPANFKELTDFEKKTLVDTGQMSADEQEELMYWSTNK